MCLARPVLLLYCWKSASGMIRDMATPNSSTSAYMMTMTMRPESSYTIKEADTANKEHSTLSEVSCLALHLAS